MRSTSTFCGTARIRPSQRRPARGKAEQQAQEIRESWDPVKQKLRELDELKQARELGEVTITYALERWLASVKADSDSGNEHTHSKYQTAAKHIGAWARSNHLIRLSQITPDALDHWKSSWSPKAKNPDDRIGNLQPQFTANRLG